MAATPACEDANLRMRAAVSSVERERASNPATRRSVRVVRGSDAAGSRRRHFGDAVLAVCFLTVVGVVVLGGLLVLFSWITTTLPTSPMVVCPELDGCAMPTPNEDQAVWADDPRMEEPKMNP